MKVRVPACIGFTLIELLIVVAIISILAAIAIPNFLEAQIRAKVARVQAEHRSLTTALEAYRLDNSDYPPDALHDHRPYAYDNWQSVYSWAWLTTPIAYIASVPMDPFNRQEIERRYYTYKNFAPPNEDWDVFVAEGVRQDWSMYSFGPDLIQNYADWYPLSRRYDPSNGTVSDGDINRWGP